MSNKRLFGLLGSKKLPKGSTIMIFNDSRGLTGVTRTVNCITSELESRGYIIRTIDPDLAENGKKKFFTIPLLFDRNIRLALNPYRPIIEEILKVKPNAIFNTTLEGSLGGSAALICNNLHKIFPKVPQLYYTSSYTTNLDTVLIEHLRNLKDNVIKKFIPNYTRKKITPKSIKILNHYKWMLYSGSYRIMVPTKTVQKNIKKIGIENTVLWPRGINKEAFRLLKEGEENAFKKYDWYKKKPKPVLTYWGRIAVEKNLDAFLKPRCKRYYRVIIGDGPCREELEQKYGKDKNIHFLGYRVGKELEALIRSSSAHIFPSVTDTFGNTILEANASGVPVVGYKVQGPKDIIKQGTTGYLRGKKKNLVSKKIIRKAMAIDKEKCREYTIKNYSWEEAADTLLENLKLINW